MEDFDFDIMIIDHEGGDAKAEKLPVCQALQARQVHDGIHVWLSGCFNHGKLIRGSAGISHRMTKLWLVSVEYEHDHEYEL